MSPEVRVVARDSDGDAMTVVMAWQEDNSVVETYTSDAGERVNTIKEACDCCGEDIDLQMTMLIGFVAHRLSQMATRLAGSRIAELATHAATPEERERMAREALRDARRPSPHHRHHRRRPN